MKIVQSFIKRKIAGECVLVPTGDTARNFNGFFTLSATGEFIWDNIEKAESLEHLISLVEEEFEVEHELVKNDTIQFVGKLLGAGFVELSQPEQSW